LPSEKKAFYQLSLGNNHPVIASVKSREAQQDALDATAILK